MAQFVHLDTTVQKEQPTTCLSLVLLELTASRPDCISQVNVLIALAVTIVWLAPHLRVLVLLEPIIRFMAFRPQVVFPARLDTLVLAWV